MAQYSEELEARFREGSRGKNIANTPLRELIAGRIDTYTDAEKKNTLAYLEDILDSTPEQLKDKPELFREAMIGSSYEQYGKNKGNTAQKLLSGIMEDAGAVASWPRQTLLKELGKTTANEMFPLEPVRRRVRFDDDVFKNLKKSMAILAEQGDNEALAQLALHSFGGFRPQDLNGINVSDIDFKTGEVLATVKTGSGVQKTTGYFAPPLLDAIKLHLGDRTSGLLFEDTKANATRINKVLAQAFGPEAIVSRNQKTGKVTKTSMRVKELRNLNESLLSAQGVDPKAESRKALTFRMPGSVAEAYTDSTANRRIMREMVSKNVSMIAGYSETPTVAQFFQDVGIPSSNTTAKIAVTQGTLEMFEGYGDTLSPEFVESIPEGDGIGFASPVKADPELSAAYKENALAGFAKTTAESKAQEAKTVIESAPDIEQAERIKAGQAGERKAARDKIKAEAAAADLEERAKEAKGIFSKMADIAQEAIDKVPGPVKKAVPFVGGAFGAAEMTGKAEAAEAEGRPFLAGIRRAQAVEELVSPTVTTGDIEAGIRFAASAEPLEEERKPGPLGMTASAIQQQMEYLMDKDRYHEDKIKEAE